MFSAVEGGAKAAEGKPALDVSRLMPAEYAGFVSAGVLFISLFLPWFSATGNGSINGLTDRSFNAWQTFATLDLLLTAACAAPFVLAWIITRGHALSWRPGEVTMIVGLLAVTLILLNGIILGKPGETTAFVSREFGYWIALLGAAGIVVSGFLRQSQSIKGRRPPGAVS
jgi:hypothetical protein